MERLWKTSSSASGPSSSPTFTLAAVLSLGLGIGLNSTIFTLVNTLFLNPLPVDHPAELIAVYTVDAKNTSPFGNLMQVSYPNYKDFRDFERRLHGAGRLLLSESGELSTGGDPDQVFVEMVSGNYFQTLGVRPSLGRFFGPAEDRAPGRPGHRHFLQPLDAAVRRHGRRRQQGHHGERRAVHDRRRCGQRLSRRQLALRARRLDADDGVPKRAAVAAPGLDGRAARARLQSRRAAQARRHNRSSRDRT